MGQELFSSNFESFLYIGKTLAFLKLVGNSQSDTALMVCQYPEKPSCNLAFLPLYEYPHK